MIAVVAPRLDEVVARAARRALLEIPEYADVTATELREGIARDLGLAMVALVEQRELTDADRAAMSLIGDTRAAQGLPIEGMLRVYRITIDEVFGVLWEAAETGDLDAADVLLLTREAWHYAGPMMEGAVGAYRKRELDLAVADSQRRTSLVHSLLLSTGGAAPELLTSVGLDPSAAFVAFRARSAGGDTRPLLSGLQLPGVLEHGLVAPYAGDVIGLAARRPTTPTGPGVVIGVGPAGRLDDLPRSFGVASRVVDTATAFGRGGVLGIEALAMEAVARSEGALGDALITRYIVPLAPSTTAGAEIIQTVRAFLDCELSAERAAEGLRVHPNTVRNRLRRFEELTEASLRSVPELTEIRLALLRASLADGARGDAVMGAAAAPPAS